MKIEISRTNRQIGEDQLIAATVETVRLPETVPPGLQSAQRSPASVHRHHQGRPGQQHDPREQEVAQKVLTLLAEIFDQTMLILMII